MNRFLQVLCVEHLNLSIVDPFVKAKLRGSPRTKVKFTCFLYPLQKSLILALFVLLGMVGVALSFPRPDDPYHKPVYHTPSHKGRVKMQVRKNKRKGCHSNFYGKDSGFNILEKIDDESHCIYG